MTKYRLNAAQKKWLEALESGKYRRTTGALKRGRGFCCLGVACEVFEMVPEKRDGAWFYDGQPGCTPLLVRLKLKLRDGGGAAKRPFTVAVGRRGLFYSLAGANDAGCSFRQIAAAIRADPENFFR